MKEYNIPKRPVGQGPFEQWCQAVHDRLFKALRFQNSNTVSVNVTPKGTWFDASAGGGAGTVLQVGVITTLFNADYIGVTAYSYESQSTQGAEFMCAKCITGRQPPSELIDEEQILYESYTDIQRLAMFNNGATEWHSIHPRYLTFGGFPLPSGMDFGQLYILYSKTVLPTGIVDQNLNDIYYIEVQPNRYWAYNPSLNGS